MANMAKTKDSSPAQYNQECPKTARTLQPVETKEADPKVGILRKMLGSIGIGRKDDKSAAENFTRTPTSDMNPVNCKHRGGAAHHVTYMDVSLGSQDPLFGSSELPLDTDCSQFQPVDIEEEASSWGCDEYEDSASTKRQRKVSGPIMIDRPPDVIESRIPKSMSLPLRQATPDPFPELANSPLTPPSSQIHLDSSKSSPASPGVWKVKSSSSYPGSGSSSPPCLHRRGSRKVYACDDSLGHPARDQVDAYIIGQGQGQLDELGSQDNIDELMRWSITKTMLQFYNDDQNWHTLAIEEGTRASDVCRFLVAKNHVVEDRNWVIVEHVSKFNLERSIEDHESVYHVHRCWGNTEDNKFYFRKDYRKYEVFKNPTQFFPPHMTDTGTLNEVEMPELALKYDRHKNILLHNLLTSDKLPEIQGNMYMKDGRKSWKKVFFLLRKSGLYYSSKGSSKDPRYLVLFASLGDVNIYCANNARKSLAAPNNHCICLKPQYCVLDTRDLKLLCAEDEEARLCWVMGMRLVKYGGQLRENYKLVIRREEKLKGGENPEDNLVKSDGSVKSRVAMDFTGPGGRVVDDPNEALGVAIEEANQWRKKVKSRNPISISPVAPEMLLSNAPEAAINRPTPIHLTIHLTQPWFQGGLSREKAVQLITQNGLVDGVFLLRESHSVADACVLSLAHNHKVKHCHIYQILHEGQWYFSLDGGHTKFTDLIQLVEFYQVNAGGLPTRLAHYAT